ncbi:phospholipid/cholesterol/gamma-HCH transport system substrate-binding protein [Nocardioides sp. J9]|uniref:MCE family protein n=1 Tax=Nocardioides sp. J9 TaxID=935844 RepID=UPI00119DEFBD|nr:MCE family protein [Nocardioides sp. J9]TWH02704.1 phospholipid/cholesterol/gamma-HCH transport system substrate-binding protein [Nocardioides sp. J9]
MAATRRSKAARVVLGLAVVLAVVAGVLAWDRASTPPDRTLVATFPRTTSLYEGAPVKVLGVRVGTVTDIEVKGTAVEVTMTYDPDVRLRPDVTAAIVPPSIVGDRFVQLAPAWAGGEVLADGARIGQDRTAVPLELDETFQQLDDLAVALGPDGADRDGALSRLTAAGAKALEGNGRRLNTTLHQLSRALGTLAEVDGDAQDVVADAARLTRTLAENDDQVRRLVLSLAEVSAQLSAQRTDLTRAVEGLSEALGEVREFTRTNRATITSSIKGLTIVSQTLDDHLDDLTDLLDLVPVGFANAMAIYAPNNWDPEHPEDSVVGGRTGSLALRGNFTEDLGVQLSYTLGAVCTQATGAEAARLLPFCAALRAAGNSIGTLLTAIAKGQQTGSLDGPLGDIVAAVQAALRAAGGGQ